MQRLEENASPLLGHTSEDARFARWADECVPRFIDGVQKRDDSECRSHGNF
jgi:hypothetical protein